MSATVPQKDSGNIFKTLESNRTPLPDLTANIDPLTKRTYHPQTNPPKSVVNPVVTPLPPKMVGSSMYGHAPADTFRTPQEIVGGAPADTNRTPQEILGGVRPPPPVASSEVKGADPPTQPVINPSSPADLKSFKDLLKKWIEPNPLNRYWQPTYHFQLSMLNDAGLLANGGTLSSVLAQMNGNELNQVIIAESGVTGFNIRDVEINTVNSQNGHTYDQKATFLTMTVAEPMGVSFLDAMFGAASLLGIWDWVKADYYLKLTFTGYNESGTFGGNPLPLEGATDKPYANGGQWLWSLKFMDIETKLNEGGGVYTLHFVHVETEALFNESNKLALKNDITVAGKTLDELFQSYTEAFNTAYAVDNGKDKDGQLVLKIAIRADHPISVGAKSGTMPKDFKVSNEEVELSSIRTLKIDSKGGRTGTPTRVVSAGTTANDFIRSAILSTEDGQKIIKDSPIPGEVNKKKKGDDKEKTKPEHRVVQLFSIEPVIDVIGYDKDGGGYQKVITLHIVPTVSQSPVLSREQANDYHSPKGQLDMINLIFNNGFLRKRYDYIFTGLNTEVIDFDIKFNMAWQAVLPRQGGIHLSELNNAIPPRWDPTKPADTPPVAVVQKSVVTPPPNPASPPVYTVQTKLEQDMTKATEAGLAENAATVLRSRQAQLRRFIEAQKIGKIYVEDVLNNINQGKMGGVTEKKARLPITFSQNFYDVKAMGGTTPTQYHPDQSIAGAVYKQLHNNTMTEAFMKIDLTIRGDPFWLGQGNIERQIILKNLKEGEPTHDAQSLPNGSSGNYCIYLYFRNPLQIGDDFKPVLNGAATFNNIYEITQVKHTFAEGQFKQVLTGVICPLINLDLVNAADPNAIGKGPESPPNANAKSGTDTVDNKNTNIP